MTAAAGIALEDEKCVRGRAGRSSDAFLVLRRARRHAGAEVGA
jgi:hypothetical protein